MSKQERLLRIAVPVPLAEGFDYLWRAEGSPPAPGCRVRVPFGRGERTGVVLEHPETSPVERGRLKPILAALDQEPVIDRELLATLRWAADYYHHPIGEVLAHALPGLLRRGRPVPSALVTAWSLTQAGERSELASLARTAPRQASALQTLAGRPDSSAEELKALGVGSQTLKRLAEKGWVVPRERAPRAMPAPAHAAFEPPELTADQRAALDAIGESGQGYKAVLLHGVTGSGKTEVYLRLIARELQAGRQTLLLVPEIGLTPQLVARLRERFGGRLALMHSALAAGERFAAWLHARRGAARLIVGTRSAVFAPLPHAGLIIVDEEHDPSYKQQQGFKYSARDLAVLRARRLGVPVLLGSATPALESFHNGLTGRYQMLAMPRRIGAAGNPKIRIIDLNRHATRHELSTPLVASMEHHLAEGNQVLLFLNRRGFAPALFCANCRSTEQCTRCDARMTVHARSGRLRCHHCGEERSLKWGCVNCGSERIAVGAGTQRVTQQLQSLHPDKRIARLDRDATARRGALAQLLADVEGGRTRILIGTQMLTKGHDFPRVTLVGVLNADQGLFGTDFRSDERLAQSILQVAGRAGRRDRPGEVVIQTHYPDHPLLTHLREHDYTGFARLALRERERAQWPPFAHLALLQAEATRRGPVFAFLEAVRASADPRRAGVTILGPAAAPMERRAGRYRGQLLFQSRERAPLHRLLRETLAQLRNRRDARRVRWTLDVDPGEL